MPVIVLLMLRLVKTVLCLGWFTVALHAQAVPPLPSAQIKDIHVPKITRPPKIEQFLGGASRSDMKRVDDFRQRQPGDGVPVSRKTSAWIGYDDRNFYAVFVCESPASQTRARMAKREDIMSDDIVGLFFDTYRSGQRAYEFFVNPLGVQADAALTESQGDDFSFDTLWYSEGRLTPEGYVAMMTIPFRSLRFSPQAVQTWGFGLFRGIPTNNENSFWPYVTEKVSGFTQQLGNMTGLENISPGRNLQLIPYAAFSNSHFLDQPSSGVPAFRGKTDFRPGLDAKAVIHDTLTLDIALNPDFSQVESDDPQVTVNQRFEVFFPEKRPFFLENAGYFSTPENLFFSRRIVDPEFGGRITGKLGQWNLGVLAIDDRAAGSTLDPGDPNSADRAAIGVVRVQRDFGKSNVGVLVTDREFAGSYNRVAALDTRLKLSDTWTFTGQAIAARRANSTARKAAVQPITSTFSTRTAIGSTTLTSSTAPKASIQTWDTLLASTCARCSSSTCAGSIRKPRRSSSLPRTSVSWGTWTIWACNRTGASVRHSTCSCRAALTRAARSAKSSSVSKISIFAATTPTPSCTPNTSSARPLISVMPGERASTTIRPPASCRSWRMAANYRRASRCGPRRASRSTRLIS
jgi:Domain of unknown function (DUF5916)